LGVIVAAAEHELDGEYNLGTGESYDFILPWSCLGEQNGLSLELCLEPRRVGEFLLEVYVGLGTARVTMAAAAMYAAGRLTERQGSHQQAAADAAGRVVSTSKSKAMATRGRSATPMRWRCGTLLSSTVQISAKKTLICSKPSIIASLCRHTKLGCT